MRFSSLSHIRDGPAAERSAREQFIGAVGDFLRPVLELRAGCPHPHDASVAFDGAG